MSFSTERAAWTAGVILAVAYVFTLCVLTSLPLQDYPAHLENAVALSDLIFHGGERFGGIFSYHFLFVPYVLGDLGFAASVEILGPRWGGAFWLSFVLLSLPLALLLFMRITGVALERRPLVFLLSLYLASDWFFLMGFLNFRLGIALTIMNLALLIRLRNEWSNRFYVCYVALVTTGYLVHLTTIALLTPALAVSSLLRLWRGTSTIRKEALLAAPLIALWAWHFGVVPRFSRPDDPIENPYFWGTLHGKLIGLDFEFARFNLRWDLVMIAVFVACLIVSAAGTRARDSFAAREMSLLAATFVGVYLALPRGYSEAMYVDVRALALASVCALLALAFLPAARTWLRVPTSGVAVALAAALVTTNLIYIRFHLAQSETRLMQYRAVVASIPTGARVLPVMTRRLPGNVSPCRHVDAFITIDRRAFMPYAFNADTANPEKYLRYVTKPYAPVENWYVKQQWGAVDWSRVAANYDYLLVEKPFDANRIPVHRRLLAENGSAALFGLENTAGTLR